jgi:hypothetical protein
MIPLSKSVYLPCHYHLARIRVVTSSMSERRQFEAFREQKSRVKIMGERCTSYIHTDLLSTCKRDSKIELLSKFDEGEE